MKQTTANSRSGRLPSIQTILKKPRPTIHDVGRVRLFEFCDKYRRQITGKGEQLVTQEKFDAMLNAALVSSDDITIDARYSNVVDTTLNLWLLSRTYFVGIRELATAINMKVSSLIVDQRCIEYADQVLDIIEGLHHKELTETIKAVPRPKWVGFLEAFPKKQHRPSKGSKLSQWSEHAQIVRKGLEIAYHHIVGHNVAIDLLADIFKIKEFAVYKFDLNERSEVVKSMNKAIEDARMYLMLLQDNIPQHVDRIAREFDEALPPFDTDAITIEADRIECARDLIRSMRLFDASSPYSILNDLLCKEEPCNAFKEVLARREQ